MFVLAALAALAGCRRTETDARSPLFDALHPPRVLTESLDVGAPASRAANRFVKGWWDYGKADGPVRLTPLAGARIQGVQLGRGPRRLILTTEVPAVSSASIEVRIDGRDWSRYPLAETVRIPIPTDVSGRFPIDIRVPAEDALGIRKARFSRALPAGEARTKGGDLVQSGYSIAEVVRRLEGPAELSGRFRPPAAARAGQRFSLELERSSGARETVLRWEQASGAVEEQSFRRPLAVEDGFVRIRFVAEGEGPAGQWKELVLRHPTGRRAAPARVPKPPRLVILYLMDALRADHLGHLGGPPGISPTIDRLAGEGASFLRHLSVAPNTVPSMKTLLTGKIFLLKGGHKLTPASGPTLAERYYASGFRTALFSGNGNVSAWRGMTRGYEHVARDVLWTGGGGPAAAGYNDNAERIHAAALDWLATLARDDRAFLHIQTIHPHNPYDPPEPFRSRFVPRNGSKIDGQTETLKSIRAGRIDPNEADQERIAGLYAASVAYNDAHLEAFLGSLLEHYDREEILLVLTSDHGEELFEHGGVLHGYTLYEEMLRIPLVVWWPGTVDSARRVEALTDNVDLHASLAALVAPETGSAESGRTLWPYLGGARRPVAASKDVLFAAASAVEGGIFMARSPRYKVIYAPRGGRRAGGHWGMGQGRGRGHDPEYVFDLEADPGERLNLAGEKLLAADWLESRLMAWIEAGKRLEAGEPLEAMDEETRRSLEALGYLQ